MRLHHQAVCFARTSWRTDLRARCQSKCARPLEGRIRQWRQLASSSSSTARPDENSAAETRECSGTLSMGNVRVGAWAEQQERAFTQAEVHAFAELTGDFNPVHVRYNNNTNNNNEVKTSSEPAIVHGFLVASLIPALVATRLPGVVYMSQGLKFRSPVLVDEPVRARVEVTTVKQLRGKRFAQIDTFVEAAKVNSVHEHRNNDDAHREWIVKIEGKAMVDLPTDA
jgi:acyl dehydratase